MKRKRSMFDLFVFDPDDGAGAGAGDPAGAADPGADPATPADPPAGDGTPSAAPAAPGWTGPSEDEWVETQQLLRQLAQGGGQPQPAAQPAGPDLSDIDLYDPQQLAAFLQARDEQMLERMQGMIGPVAAHTQAQQQSEAEARARDILTDYGSQQGVEFDAQIARDIAEPLMGQAFERFGVTPRAAEYALHQAADRLIAHDKQVADKAVNAYKAQLEAAAGAPRDPGAGGAGAGVEAVGEAESEYEAVQRAFARSTTT